MKCAFVVTGETKPSDDGKNSGPLGLERADVVETSRIRLINKGRLLAKG